MGNEKKLLVFRLEYTEKYNKNEDQSSLDRGRYELEVNGNNVTGESKTFNCKDTSTEKLLSKYFHQKSIVKELTAFETLLTNTRISLTNNHPTRKISIDEKGDRAEIVLEAQRSAMV